MKRNPLFSTLLLLQLGFSINAQEAQKQWLGKRITNTAFHLDPTEIQTFGSITALVDQEFSNYQYLPFGFGGNTSLFSKQLSEYKGWEIVAEFGTFTQFEWRTVEGEQQRNLINTDYKVALNYSRKVDEKFTYRFRFFHVSSHLGDDYLIRNSVNSYSENKVNYEQLDFTAFYQWRPNWRLIAGLGSVVRPEAKRLPFSYQIGSVWNKQTATSNWGWSGGFSVKGFQELEFQPAVKLGFGPAFYSKEKAEPLRVQLEYYNGHLPYSQYEQNQVEWYGIGLYFYL